MKLEKLSAIAELVSSIAILATLGYMAVQTKQDMQAIQATVRQALLTEDREFLKVRRGSGRNAFGYREAAMSISVLKYPLPWKPAGNGGDFATVRSIVVLAENPEEISC